MRLFSIIAALLPCMPLETGKKILKQVQISLLDAKNKPYDQILIARIEKLSWSNDSTTLRW